MGPVASPTVPSGTGPGPRSPGPRQHTFLRSVVSLDRRRPGSRRRDATLLSPNLFGSPVRSEGSVTRRSRSPRPRVRGRTALGEGLPTRDPTDRYGGWTTHWTCSCIGETRTERDTLPALVSLLFVWFCPRGRSEGGRSASRRVVSRRKSRVLTGRSVPSELFFLSPSLSLRFHRIRCTFSPTLDTPPTFSGHTSRPDGGPEESPEDVRRRRCFGTLRRASAYT